MLNVLVTMRFGEAQLDRLRAVSPCLPVTRDDPETADYSRTGDPDGVLPDEWFSCERVPELLARSDAVVVCAPLTPESVT